MTSIAYDDVRPRSAARPEMSVTLLREAIDLLFQEAYDGPPNPEFTWFVTNARDGGVLGTSHRLTAEQAWRTPPGLAHSVAEHLAHLLFSLDLAMREAVQGEPIEADWDRSWDVGPPDEVHWHSMQRRLRESHLRLRIWVHSEEALATRESVARVLGAIAHAAYHLGAIRQVAALATRHGDDAR